MKGFITVFVMFALLAITQSIWTSEHLISGDASNQLSAGIKAKLYSSHNMKPQWFEPSHQ